MRTRIAGGLFVSHLGSETDLKSHKTKKTAKNKFGSFLVGNLLIQTVSHNRLSQ